LTNMSQPHFMVLTMLNITGQAAHVAHGLAQFEALVWFSIL